MAKHTAEDIELTTNHLAQKVIIDIPGVGDEIELDPGEAVFMGVLLVQRGRGLEEVQASTKEVGNGNQD